MVRPGWGARHPQIARVLAQSTPAATQETAWANGTRPLRLNAYREVAQLPDELVVSVRCLVRVGDRVVVCTNLDGLRHVWPGGRRQPGESFARTAAREVEEETGWLLSPGSFRLLGWLHIEHLRPVPEDHPYPHPDFCQVVGAATAAARRTGPDDEWTDTEGWEVSSELMSVPDAERAIDGDPLGRVFLAMLSG
jgi:8-oxo-dGTP pyrophosphatase MutT (NUDIX family)